MSHLTYVNNDGERFKLVPGPEYKPGHTACQGCAFKIGGTRACIEAKSCTPVAHRGERLVGAGYVWVFQDYVGDEADGC